MGESNFVFWEPEETVGAYWHDMISKAGDADHFPEAEVTFEQMVGRISLLFRALGGDQSVELKAASAEKSKHRLSWLRRMGNVYEQIQRPAYDGTSLSLPLKVDAFPEKHLNEDLYKWLAVFAIYLPEYHEPNSDPLKADLEAIKASWQLTQQMLEDFPALKNLYWQLCAVVLKQRPRQSLPRMEQAVEEAIRALLGDDEPPSDVGREMLGMIKDPGRTSGSFPAPKDYKPHRSVPLWIDIRQSRYVKSRPSDAQDSQPETGDGEDQREREEGRHKATRRKSDNADDRNSLLLARFEAILSWTEFLNIKRHVEDDDEDNAKKAKDDMEELGLADIKQKPNTLLAFDLDMAPEDMERVKSSGKVLYPEWDCKTSSYIPDYCSVLIDESDQEEAEADFMNDPEIWRRVNAVKRQFEALRPKRSKVYRQLDGDDLDMEAAIRSWVDLKATGESSDRVFTQSRTVARDLAVCTLMDVSRSTESVVEGRSIIDIEREALAALAYGLDMTGDDHAIYTFSSLNNDKIFMRPCKTFEEKMNDQVIKRISALKPGHYTRLGAAIRHMTKVLEERQSQKRLMLVITDGKPNDLDHYEGRHGIEDTRKAVLEARRAGHSVFGVTVDSKARAYLPRIFGQNGYAIMSHPSRLTNALPMIYRHLVT
ncbi:nitric oxide reductase activation protein NorD [Cohaesibacter gelatinilyticus]|uniref:Nitric oxide reductase NorD protein n=1 Tax=Cohaesibacter gelatinilyticus TaxID=372072 RepID=A0A285NCN2_9HYPH|nr:VWA domain-containing protein [Cohaesibacter gelatinilyticus]SNZ07210.1 nitric oxide reductase NorD protein [Cohaesibacter gelatinilyticus]